MNIKMHDHGKNERIKKKQQQHTQHFNWLKILAIMQINWICTKGVNELSAKCMAMAIAGGGVDWEISSAYCHTWNDLWYI